MTGGNDACETKDMQKNRLNITIDHCRLKNEDNGCVNRPSDVIYQVTSQTSQAYT